MDDDHDDEAPYDSEAHEYERQERLKEDLVRQLSFIKTAVANEMPVDLVRHAMKRITHAILDIDPEHLVFVVENFATLEADYDREVAKGVKDRRSGESAPERK